MVNEEKRVPTELVVYEIKSSFKNKEYAKVEHLCKTILNQNPNNAEAHHYLGLLAKHFNKDKIALAHMQNGIRIKENELANWYMDFGNTLYKEKEYDKAIAAYSRALHLSPQLSGFIYNNIGAVYKNKGELEKSIECYKKSIEISPKNPSTYCNLSLAYKEKAEFEEAIKQCKNALEVDENSIAAYYNWGLALKDQNKPEEAIPFFEKVIEKDYNYTDIHRDLAICQIVTKDFENGWKSYENRYHGLIEPRPIKNIKKWQNEPLQGKTIYVLREQGNGDTIQFVRYLPTLKEMGANVIFRCQSGLKNLFEQSDLQAEIVEETTKEEFEADYYTLLLSLPYHLKTTDTNIPQSKGYLKTEESKVKEYKEKYFDTDKLKVGIFWQGSPTFKNDRNRSVKLENFYDLGKIPNIQLYSIQKGTGVEQLENVPDSFNIIQLGDTFNDFSDTAAAIDNLDLVITVDSAVGHLAGALGKPVWMLSFYVWEWRWFRCTDKTPWYDSMKIYHQEEPKSWAGVFERVKKDLEELSPEP